MAKMPTAKVIVVLSFNIPLDKIPKIADVIEKIDPPNLPYFAGELRVAVDEPRGEKVASKVIDYLDNENGNLV